MLRFEFSNSHVDIFSFGKLLFPENGTDQPQRRIESFRDFFLPGLIYLKYVF